MKKEEMMTAPHVIKKLSEKNNWFIVLKNDHDIALMFNALIDCKHLINKEESNIVGVYKCGVDIHPLLYKDLKYISESSKDITEWFFKEVNNF